MKTRIYAAPAVKGLTFKPLGRTIVVFNPFYYPFESQLLGKKSIFKRQDLQFFGVELNRYK